MTNTMQTNIKKQLAEKNMTAAELERRTGIPHAVINILHGRSKNPSIRTAQAIAKELGCSVEELLSEVSPKGTIENKKYDWDPELYKQSFDAIYNYITNLNLKPKATLVAECITEVYMYTVDSPEKIVDLRFVKWLIDKNLKHSDNTLLSE